MTLSAAFFAGGGGKRGGVDGDGGGLRLNLAGRGRGGGELAGRGSLMRGLGGGDEKRLGPAA